MPRLISLHSRSSRQRSARKSLRSLTARMEPLEARQLMAASAYMSGNEFRFYGTNLHDTVVISVDTKNTPTKADDVFVVNYSAPGTPNAKFTVPLASVKDIFANMEGGSNSFTNNTAVPCTVQCGDDGDSIVCGSGNDSVFGGPGNDSINGGGGNDAIWSVAGNDVIFGGDGNDSIHGGLGNDSIHGGGGADYLYGEEGDDWLNGDTGFDVVHGGDGNDTIVSLDNAFDLVYGDAGSDSFWTDAGVIDPLNDASAAEVAAGHIHPIAGFQPYSIVGIGAIPVSTTLNGPKLFDPYATDPNLGLANYAASPLFSHNGPAPADVKQGSIGDCYFMAGLGAVAKTAPDRIRQLVVDLGDGTYAVNFHNNGKNAFVRVDADLWTKFDGSLGYAKKGIDGSIWVPIVEKAWAFYRNNKATYSSTEGGNNLGIDWCDALGLSHIDFPTNLSPNATSFLTTIRNELLAGKAITIGGPAALAPGIPLIATNYRRGQHIFTVDSVIMQNNVPVSLKLRNPYGSYVTVSATEAYFCCGGIKIVTV